MGANGYTVMLVGRVLSGGYAATARRLEPRSLSQARRTMNIPRVKGPDVRQAG